MSTSGVGLYKIFFHFEAFVHESIILYSPLPTCIAHTIEILLYGYCAKYYLPPNPPCVCHTPYNVGDCNIL